MASNAEESAVWRGTVATDRRKGRTPGRSECSLRGLRRRPDRAGRRISLLIRRTHMYVALFVTPWLAMYTLSTIVFNHAAQVDRLYQKLYGPGFDRYEMERQLSYGRTFRLGTSVRTRAEEILSDLHLNGSFGVENTEDRLVITRRDPFVPRRITFYPSTHRLVVERQNSRLASILTTLHTQVSYTNKLKRIKAWAASVDLTVVTMLLLVFSGLWMWWDLKRTRFTGSMFLFMGVLLFCGFLFLA